MSKFIKKLVDIPILEANHIENLKSYKYASSEYTKLDSIMNHFWLFTARFVPKVESFIRLTKIVN